MWYIRRSRKRFEEAVGTLVLVLQTLSKLTAPFVPFLSEEIYQCLPPGGKQSVHLQDWPRADKRLIDRKLNQEMDRVREVVRLALAERSKAGIKVRQPLQKLKVKSQKLKVNRELLGLIKDEVNIKEIVFDSNIKKEVELDARITPELKEEGIVREIVRLVNELRKKTGLVPKDRISIQYFGDSELNKILERNKKVILDRTKAEDFILRRKLKKVFLAERELKIDQQKLWLAIKKI